jgi:hypothetical protein
MKSAAFTKSLLLLAAIFLLLMLICISGNIGLWVAIAMLVSIGVTLLYYLIAQIGDTFTSVRRSYVKVLPLKVLATLMGLLLVVGTLSYIYVFHVVVETNNIENFSNAEYLFRSLICSLDLFMLDIDSNILDRLDNHAALKGWLSIQAILSFACTIAMLVSLVYSRLRAFYLLNYRTKVNNKRNHLYLFFGNNEPSKLLIRDIMRNDTKARVIVIDVANLQEEDNDEWKNIVSLVAHKQVVFQIAERIGARVAIASQRLVDIDEDIANRADFDAFVYLGLTKIKKMVTRLFKTSDPQLHIFFMDNDEELNIRNIITLAKDVTILSMAKKDNLEHQIYCHARYNGPNRVIQDVALNKKLNIKIVDSSHIGVELLKLDKAYHPVNVVKTSDKCLATVTTPFKALIVGFGEVGRDAFRFLYEFGAFVDSNDVNSRSEFECTVVDNNLENIEGPFKASMPAIFGENAARKSVTFVNTDSNGEQFNALVLNERFLKEVNYVIISIGNNDEAIELATRIFRRIRQQRQDVSNLRILVRCTSDDKDEYVQKIADHYNYGYDKGVNNVPIIHIFGQPRKTYTYDLVVSNRLTHEGKLFQEKYCKLSGEGEDWDSRHRKLTKTEVPNIDKLRKLRRQESQDRANALHSGTKMILLEDAMNRISSGHNSTPEWYSFYLRYFNVDNSTYVEGTRSGIRYPGLSERENEAILHLAMLEHLRWNAAHELMGYVFNEGGKECDERTMQHNCLCSWDKLDGQSDMITDWDCDYKKYDFCVVDTTIALSKDKLLYPE